MSIFTRSNFVRRSFMLAAICGAGVAVMSAQSSQPVAQTVTAPLVNFRMLAIDPALDTVSSSSSSSTADDEASVTTVDPLHLDAMQYQGRRRYGRPRYRGGNTNSDGSNKWIFYGGVGLAQPLGNTWHYFTPSWGFQVGAGRQFNKHFAVPIEFNFDHFGMTKQTLDNELALYNADINYECNLPANAAACVADGVTDFSTLDGNMHDWSFSVNPRYTFYQGDGWGGYAFVGAGFYHKVSNFLTPEEEEFDSFFGPEEFVANQVIDHYSSNSPGFAAGLGVTYKFSHFSNERLYAEARYVFTDNSYRPGVTVNSSVPATYAETNDFPANSNRTTYVPLKFGIQF